MAEYSLTPYQFSISPKGKPSDRLKMTNVSHAPDLTGADFVANCFFQLVEEEEPRTFGMDNTRLLEGVQVLRAGEQVLLKLKVGVKGFNSSLDLEELGASAERKFEDAEWFHLRALFVSVKGSRNALLLVERVASYSAYGPISEMIKTAARINLAGDISARFEPIQDIRSMGEQLGEMLTKAVEFRAVMPTEDVDIADAAAGENHVRPFERIVNRANRKLKRNTKYYQRGGLGRYSQFQGKSIEELSEAFGYVPAALEETEVVATVETSQGKPRTLSIQKEETPSVSFSIERDSSDYVPSDEEFLKTASFVVEGTVSMLGVQSLELSELGEFKEVDSLKSFESWRIDE